MLNRVLRRAQRALPSAPRRWMAEAAAQPLPPRAAAALAAEHPLRLLTAPWLLTAVPSLALLVTACGGLALFGTFFVDSRVSDKLAAVIAQNAVLSARVDGIAKEVDAKTAGLASSVTKEVDAKTAGLASSLIKEVDAKTAGLASSLTKEVDAKMAGLASEVDAKTAGLAREVDAKVAGVIAAAGLKADAETMRVLREYKVRGRR